MQNSETSVPSRRCARRCVSRPGARAPTSRAEPSGCSSGAVLAAVGEQQHEQRHQRGEARTDSHRAPSATRGAGRQGPTAAVPRGPRPRSPPRTSRRAQRRGWAARSRGPARSPAPGCRRAPRPGRTSRRRAARSSGSHGTRTASTADATAAARMASGRPIRSESHAHGRTRRGEAEGRARDEERGARRAHGERRRDVGEQPLGCVEQGEGAPGPRTTAQRRADARRARVRRGRAPGAVRARPEGGARGESVRAAVPVLFERVVVTRATLGAAHRYLQCIGRLLSYDHDMSDDPVAALLPHLRLLVALGEVEHVTIAAAMLGVPQPTVSRTVRRLERRSAPRSSNPTAAASASPPPPAPSSPTRSVPSTCSPTASPPSRPRGSEPAPPSVGLPDLPRRAAGPRAHPHRPRRRPDRPLRAQPGCTELLPRLAPAREADIALVSRLDPPPDGRPRRAALRAAARAPRP